MDIKDQLDGLVTKYTELLLGSSDADLKEKVQAWVIYSYIAKSMPPLVNHWNQSFPEAKEEMKKMIAEIKQLNDEYRTKKKPLD